MIWIVTIKNNKHPDHDPHNKKKGICGQSNICTDSTGAHHCFLVRADRLKDVEWFLTKERPYYHITRIELARSIIRVI